MIHFHSDMICIIACRSTQPAHSYTRGKRKKKRFLSLSLDFMHNEETGHQYFKIALIKRGLTFPRGSSGVKMWNILRHWSVHFSYGVTSENRAAISTRHKLYEGEKEWKQVSRVSLMVHTHTNTHTRVCNRVYAVVDLHEHESFIGSTCRLRSTSIPSSFFSLSIVINAIWVQHRCGYELTERMSNNTPFPYICRKSDQLQRRRASSVKD